ncbi:MAG: hypothetical protein K0Q65_1712 [Clostridia bacterium]|nr:hypothetical protein [Clostridia bacterium]
MKKLLIAFIVLLNIIFVGCESNISSLSVEEKKVVKNSIEFIKQSSFASKNNINTNIIKVESATEDTWDIVLARDHTKKEEKAVDSTDWVITIGNTSNHDFAVIVCDSSTHEVIGYIPIK